MYCKISNLIVKFNNKYSLLEKRCKKYIVEPTDYDIEVSITEDDIRKEQTADGNAHEIDFYESNCAQRNFVYQLPKYDAILLHSAVFEIDGKGVALLARSGTGKTTHLLLWKKIFSDRMKIINGDKPIVRFEGEELYAYGSPWCGKENYGINDKTQLMNLCFLERSRINYVDKMENKDVVNLIMNQIVLPDDTMGRIKTLQIIDKLIKKCNIWTIHCNMEDEAAEIAYKTIFEAGI